MNILSSIWDLPMNIWKNICKYIARVSSKKESHWPLAGSVFLLYDFEMKYRAEDSLSIKNKEANKDPLLKEMCRRVSALPATSLPPVTKLRMSGTFCSQSEESMPDLLRSRKIGILWLGCSGSMTVADRWKVEQVGSPVLGLQLKQPVLLIYLY